MPQSTTCFPPSTAALMNKSQSKQCSTMYFSTDPPNVPPAKSKANIKLDVVYEMFGLFMSWKLPTPNGINIKMHFNELLSGSGCRFVVKSKICNCSSKNEFLDLQKRFFAPASIRYLTDETKKHEIKILSWWIVIMILIEAPVRRWWNRFQDPIAQHCPMIICRLYFLSIPDNSIKWVGLSLLR